MKLEIEKLAEMLEEAGIPHVNLTKSLPIRQILYTPKKGDDEVCSIIQGIYTYGGDENLLETKGLTQKGNENKDIVIGYLTAQEVFTRISKHWNQYKNPELKVKNYEIMYIHKVAKTEIINEFNKYLKELIEKLQGTIQEVNVWGTRNMPTETASENQGIYVLISFQCPPESLKEIDSKLRQKEEILRHMIIRL